MFGWVTDRCEKQHQRVCPVAKYAQSKSHNPAHSLCHWVIMRIHAYPKITFSDNKNHPSLKHSIIFQNTSPSVSPHLWNKSSNKILWENCRAIHCAPPLTIPRSWEPCLPITLDCPPVQSFHNGATKFRVHASVTFLINDDEKPLLMVGFLKRLETSPFHWRRHAFPPTWNNFANGALTLKIYLAPFAKPQSLLWAIGAALQATILVWRTRGWRRSAHSWCQQTVVCRGAPVGSGPSRAFPLLPSSSLLPSPCLSGSAHHCLSRGAGCKRL